MFGVCLRYSNNYDDAQDVMQDGFLKVFQKIGQFEFKGAFEGWVRRIMINTALEKYRNKYQVINLSDNLKNETDSLKVEDITSSLSAQELLGFVQELSPKYRMVFNLYAIEGYQHKDIAKMLNISEGTSKSNLSRARAILQEKVKRYFNLSVKVGE
ncbi:MAG: RNA polymerase sigma factor [Bacteroidales bacterium]|nr:RNA polymerase sigma factor [Bacteroidales bacterium]